VALSNAANRDLVATRTRFTKEVAGQLWEHYNRSWPVSLERARFARGVIDGDIKAPVPPEVELGRKTFEQRLAEPTTVPIHTQNLITAKWPAIIRGEAAVGITAQTVSSRIEGLANAQFLAAAPWAEAMGYLLNEAHVAWAIFPEQAYYKRAPDFYGDDGEPMSMWRRDETGRAPYDEGYDDTRRDASATRRAYSRAKEGYLAGHVCSVIEIYGREEAVPINLRWVGKDLQLDGLITRRKFSKTELIHDHGFVWRNMGGPQLSPSEDEFAEAELLTIWRCDKDGPYIAYSVNGEDTWRQDNTTPDRKMVDAVIDLKQFGMDELPVTWQMGWHTARRDMDKAGIPFPWAFGSNWATANAIISALCYRQWAYSYLGPFIELPADDQVLARLQSSGGILRDFQLKPMTAQTVPGKVTFPVAPGSGPDTSMVLAQVLGSNQSQATPTTALGGPGAASGLDRSLTVRQALDALGQIMDAGLALARFSARIQNKYYVGMSETIGEPLPIRVNPAVPPGGESTNTKPIITVPKDMFGGVYDMDAEYPRKPGENIPQVQQWFEIFQGGGMDYFEFRELGFGDQSPDVSLARRVVWDYVNSPEGRMDLMAGIAEYAKDERMKAIIALQQKGKVNRAGLPVALGDNVPEPDMGALGIGSPGGSSLGGIVQGPMAEARSVVPESPAGEAMSGF
jgi:hypothetical protein